MPFKFSILTICIVLVIILFGIGLYASPLMSTSFYFDDHISIQNDAVINIIDIPKIFNAFNTRFLVGLSFAFNYQWCHLQPFGYRFINLLIHSLNAFLVYLLIKTTLHLYWKSKPMLLGRIPWAAFFAAMLFFCHPIQTEAVNSITQRFVLMGTLFYLLTMYLYILYRCRFQKRYLITSMGTAIAAMFCKEFVVTLPLMLVLYEFCFLNSLSETLWKRLRRLIPFFIIASIVPLLLLRAPPEALGIANIANTHSIQRSATQEFGRHTDITRAFSHIGRQQYFLTELNVLCTYVRLLFLPMNQNFDYDYPISNQMDHQTMLSGLFLFCLLVAAVVTYKTHRIVSFSIGWFFIALSVESSFIPIGHVIAEYRLYLASFGFVFLVIPLIYMREVDLKKLNVMVGLIMIVFSMLTYQRNKVWKDELSLWKDAVRKSPHKASSYNGRGFGYVKQGDFLRALPDFNKAIELDPNFAEAYNNRAATYFMFKEYDKAWSEVKKAMELGAHINPYFLNALKKASGRDS